MEKLFEIVMLICFCAALFVMIVGLAKQNKPCSWFDRIKAITMGVGFLIGAIAKIVTDSADWSFIFYALGIDLAYTATIFAFRKNDENN